MTLLRAVGYTWDMARGLESLGHVLLEQGMVREAREAFAESLGLWRDLGNKTDILVGVAGIAALEGRFDKAARLGGAVAAHIDRLSLDGRSLDVPFSMAQAAVEHSRVTARAGLDEETFARAWAEGQSMTLEQAVVAALEPDGSLIGRPEQPSTDGPGRRDYQPRHRPHRPGEGGYERDQPSGASSP